MKTTKTTAEAVDEKRALGVARARERLARGSRSFALAGKLLPSGVRDDAAVLYAWCRRVDDAVDDVPPAQGRVALAEARATLAALQAGAPQDDAELHAFQEVLRRREIPRVYPEELLEGMAMDVEGRAYETWDELRLYCFRVAGTVGLMMAHVMGLEERRYLRQAAELGIAMQLTNIARDVEEDWRRGRLYVPASWLPGEAAAAARGGTFPRALRETFKGVLARLLDEADATYRRAEEGLAGLPTRSAVAVSAARQIYAAIGARLQAQGLDVTAGRAVVPGWRKLWLALGAALGVLGQRGFRAFRHLAEAR